MECCFEGCERDPLCRSGNIGGGLVCRQHYQLTNGTKAEDLSYIQKIEIEKAYEEAQRRKQNNGSEVQRNSKRGS